MDRRRFLITAAGAGVGLVGVRYLGSAIPMAHAADGPYGPLLGANGHGIELPAGFTSRVVATSGSAIPGGYVWHGAPDGGACFAEGSGWLYASNSELSPGGVGTLRFDASGNVIGGQRILSGTARNCAGGATPWGTWLSCEETASGLVWETFPLTGAAAVSRPAMGAFNHEAAACDPVRQHVYLTEDAGTGKLRRFRPTVWGDLSSGVLEAAVVSGSTVTWTTNIAGGSAFNGGEGLWYADGKVWFTTKGDNRVWELNVAASPNTIRVIYDDNTSPNPVLTGVDNIVGSASGDLFIAEDGGNMEIVIIEPNGAVSVFIRVLGQSGSEIAGPAFNPDGTRLYFSSQRGGNGSGITYEVTGPFRNSAPSTTTTTAPPATTTTTAAPVNIALTATKRIANGKHFVDLVWSGATASSVEIRRNGSVITTTVNDGAHTDALNKKRGTFHYRVSHPGGTPISNEVTVTF